MGNERWRSFRIACLETDLWVAVDKDKYNGNVERFTAERTQYYRKIIETHITDFPEFRDSLVPVKIPANVHQIIISMCEAAKAAGTGPMSAVAGSMSEYICNDLLDKFRFREVIVENGGDIFMKLTEKATVSVNAGLSPLSDKIGIIVKPEDTSLSVCCSSGTTGHSLSFGVADACVIACRSGAQADAYATAFCNKVKNITLVKSVTEMVLQKPDILSVVIIKDDIVGMGGKMEIKI
jgi:ApbE superfamily uncharacterized protein (UPF0280 family)